MSRILLVFRTLIHVKPVQILNRLWRKFLPKGTCGYKGSTEPLGEFEFLNTKGNPNGWNDPRFEKLWLYNLHYFDYLVNDKIKVEGEDEGEQRKDSLVLRWIKENPKGWGNGWEPYPISLRVVNWIKYFMQRGRSPCPTERKSLEMQMGWLYSRLEYHLLANHLLANAKALVFAGKFLGNEMWYKKGMAIYKKELPEQTCADGINFERSPMYHSIILEDMLDCLELVEGNWEQGIGNWDAKLFKEYAAKMLVGLKMLAGPDGKIAKFNDSTEGIAKTPEELFAVAERLGIHCSPSPFTFTSSSGFIRQEAGQWTLLAKCGDIGPSYQPGHAHADTFTFELWKSGRKVISDTGCSTYVPGPIRSYERSTAAHNTVVIDGKNSSEVWAAHRVGRRFDFGKHRRGFELTAEGLKGMDEIFGHGEHDLEIRFHLPPGVAKDDLRVECAGELSWEACDFAEGWNLRKPGLCAIFRSRQKLPTVINWSVS